MDVTRFHNSMNRSLSEDRPVLGTIVCTIDPAVIEVMGCAGFDYVVIDLEHGRIDIQTVEHLVRAAELWGMAAVVRVPKGETGTILRCLEAGAAGILLSHCTSAADGRALVETMRFPPVGCRGYATNTRVNDYS